MLLMVIIKQELLELLIEVMAEEVVRYQIQVLVVQALLYYLCLQIDTLEQLQEVLVLQPVAITQY